MAGLALKLIVGLGNPGRKFARTRHNAGWWLIDALLERQGGTWRQEPAQHAEVARVRLEECELWLAKPMLFMNRSGEAVSALAHFYRIAAPEILIVHDDIDLPPGVARLKQAGGHGGHNGLRDVIAHIGADFWRLRLGVGHPGARELVLDSVLERPTAAEQPLIEEAVQRGLAAVPELLRDGAQKTMHRLHSENREPPAA
ncbi:MAG TPA: aminoacyl-tRNA hydrolase [Steroidobacteraceae bacterium]